jgi:hypothetical protein
MIFSVYEQTLPISSAIDMLIPPFSTSRRSL